MDILLFTILAFLLLILILLFLIMKRPSQIDFTQFNIHFEVLEKSFEKLERVVREELALGRGESTKLAREQRQELVEGFKSFGQSVVQRITEVGSIQTNQLEGMSGAIEKLSETNEKKLEELRKTVEGKL